MYTAKVITEDEYKTLRARYDEYHAQWKIVCAGHLGYASPEDQKLLPEPLTHEQISSIETYEFCFDPPQKYFAYVHEEEREVKYTEVHVYKVPTHITTWTGEVLGRITEYGTYKNNWGDTRVSLRVTAINGKHYYGTFYKSAGDYCRLTMCKADR